MSGVGLFGSSWIATRLARGEIVRSTSRSQRDALRSFVKFLGSDFPLAAVQRCHIEDWQAAQRTVSPGTRRLRFMIVREMFAWAVENGYLARTPFLGLKAPRKPRRVPRGLNDDLAAKVLVTVADPRDRVMVSLMLREGLRSVEVSRLQLADVDRVNRSLRIVGKGGHERVIPLTQETSVLVESYLAEERGETNGHLIRSRNPSPHNPGDGIVATTVVDRVGAVMHRAGVHDGGHALRHTFAYGLMEAGADVRDVQLALGHVSLVTTQIYLPAAKMERLRGFMGKKDYRMEAG